MASFWPATGMANLVSVELTERGIEFYEAGEFHSAVESFSKAVLADPHNKEAQEYLVMLGVPGGLYAPRGSAVSRTAQLFASLQQYQQYVNQVQNEKQNVSRLNRVLESKLEESWMAIQEREEENLGLAEMLVEMEQDAAQNKKTVQQIKSAVRKKEREIAKLNADLYDMAYHYEDMESAIQNRETELNETREAYLDSQRRWQEEAIQYHSLLTDYERTTLNRKDNYLDAKARDHDQINLLQNKLWVADEERKDAQYQLRLVSRKLTILEDKLQAKDYSMVRLNAAVASLQEDISLLPLPPAPATSPAAPTPLPEPQEDLREIRWIERDAAVSDIRQRLGQTRQAIDSMESGSKEPESESLISLQNQLSETQEALKSTRSLLDEKNSGYQLLEKRLGDAQERLDIVEQMLQEREKQVQQLEKQLEDYLSLTE